MKKYGGPQAEEERCPDRGCYCFLQGWGAVGHKRGGQRTIRCYTWMRRDCPRNSSTSRETCALGVGQATRKSVLRLNIYDDAPQLLQLRHAIGMPPIRSLVCGGR